MNEEEVNKNMDRARKLAEDKLNEQELEIVDFAESMNNIFDEKEQAIKIKDRMRCENDRLYQDILKFNRLVGNVDLSVKSAIESARMLGTVASALTSLDALRNIRKVIDEFDKDRNQEKEVWESYSGTRGK